MLATRQLGKCFNGTHWAVRHLSIYVNDGELVMLLGANGAGKTTAINCFLDFITPNEGDAIVDGVAVSTDPLRAKSRIAYVPELVAAYATMSGVQNLRFFASLGGDHIVDASGAHQALLAQGLPPDSLRRPVGTYSKGMRQKLGLAIANVRQAPNLILDEPTSGLDPVSARELMDSLRALRDAGRAILVSSHDIHRAREYADRIYILREGALRRTIETSELVRANMEELYHEVMREPIGVAS